MRGRKTTLIIILLLVWCTCAYSQEEPASVREVSGSAPEKATAGKEDDRLPIYKKGWQFFLAPYLWVPGAHLDLSHQGGFRGTIVADVPWYNLVPYFSAKSWGAWAGWRFGMADGV